MPSAWGHTRLLETDWRFITQESHCFSCGSVKEDLMRTMRGGIFGSGLRAEKVQPMNLHPRMRMEL